MSKKRQSIQLLGAEIIMYEDGDIETNLQVNEGFEKHILENGLENEYEEKTKKMYDLLKEVLKMAFPDHIIQQVEEESVEDKLSKSVKGVEIMFKEQIKELTNMFERLADEIEETERSLKVKKQELRDIKQGLDSLERIQSKYDEKEEVVEI